MEPQDLSAQNARRLSPSSTIDRPGAQPVELRTVLRLTGAKEYAPAILPRRKVMVVGLCPARAPEGAQLPPEEWPIFKTLNQWLVQAGFGENYVDRIYFTNLWPYYVDKAHPSVEMFRKNSDWFWEQVQRVDPKIIITLGGSVSAWVSNQPVSMIRDVGSTFVTRVPDGRPRIVLPLPHTSGRSRFQNTEAGKNKLVDGIRELSHLRIQMGIDLK